MSVTKVEQLFPPNSPGACVVKDCKDKRNPHYHVLEKQRELLDSTEKYIALVGGYGSAKTLAACVLGHLLSIGVDGNMGIVLRRSLPKLHDSTERIYLEVLQRSGVSFSYREMRDGWPGRIIYGNGSEVVFRETKDLGRFLGPEYGWFYIDEAQEEPEKTFKDLVGRLRLPRARRYLRGILATNPPSSQHWVARLFPHPGSYKKTIEIRGGKKVTSSYRMIQSSTYDNPFLSNEYIADIVQNNAPSEVKRIIEGFYGFVQDGDPVYPMFDFLKHVDDIKTFMLPVYRVWDFGFGCPAVMWGQLFKCKRGVAHATVLHELESKDTYAEELAKKALIHTKLVFPEHPVSLIVDGGDAAGAQTNDKGPGAIIRLAKPVSEGGFNLRFRYRKFGDIDPGLELVRKLLKTRCQCGYHLLMIHRRCRWLIEALAGGYHYPKEKPGKDTKKKPIKDGYYDNVADVLRYFTMLFYQPFAAGTVDQSDWTPDALTNNTEPWTWMTGTGGF